MHKKIVVGALAASIVSGAAVAADMAQPAPVYRPAPVVAPPPVYNWTGIYIGANGGYGSARGSADILWTGSIFGTIAATGSGSGVSGGIAGGQIGGNYQAGVAVFGFEVDGQWSGQQKTTTTGCGVGCTFTETVKIKSFATARGRLGVAADRVLVYATGGAAWTSASDDLSSSALGVTVNLLSTSANKVGWTVGGGIEVAFAGNWSLKAEYLYIQTDNLTATTAVTPLLGGGTITETVKIQDHIGRVGINYRFGGGYVGY